MLTKNSIRTSASTFDPSCEIGKFDDKNFVLWKEMMQDVLIIRCQIKAIRQKNKSTSMTIEDWRSLYEVGSLTIWMHLAKNVYFSMAKETTAFSLWERLQSMCKKKSSSLKLILIRQLFNIKMKEIGLATSYINTFSRVLIELSSIQGLKFEEEIKTLHFSRASQQAGEFFVR